VGEALFGKIDDALFRVSTPFGGGFGRSRQELCGVLPGAAMIIGLLYGRTEPEESSLAAYAVTAAYRERFLEQFGHTICDDLRERAGYGTDENPCLDLSGEAAALLIDVLSEAPAIIVQAEANR